MKLETYRPTVGTLANPVILTDAAMTIHFANPAALRFLDTSGLVRELGGKLAICNIANRRALEKAVEAAERGDSEIGTHGIGVPLNAAESSYPAVAYVLPIGRTPKRTLHNSASVAVFISSQHGAMPTAPAVMATLFGMTAAEANVAAELYSGGTIVDIATRTGVPENTIKSHAQRIYSKTETRSRSELVSLLSTLAPRISFDQAGQGQIRSSSLFALVSDLKHEDGGSRLRSWWVSGWGWRDAVRDDRLRVTTFRETHDEPGDCRCGAGRCRNCRADGARHRPRLTELPPVRVERSRDTLVLR